MGDHLVRFEGGAQVPKHLIFPDWGFLFCFKFFFFFWGWFRLVFFGRGSGGRGVGWAARTRSKRIFWVLGFCGGGLKAPSSTTRVGCGREIRDFCDDPVE